jgi:energy-converting hydrogenase Eha subunit F
MLMNIPASATSYVGSFEVTNGQSVAKRTMLVIIVRHPTVNMPTTANLWPSGILKRHTAGIGMMIKAISLAVFVTAVAR